jgi:hypothetical protein
MEVAHMSTSTRVRAAFGGGVSLIALALSGLFAGVAAAAPAVFDTGKNIGYPTSPAASAISTTSVIVIAAAIIVTAGVIAWAAFGLDRRSRTQLRLVEGSDQTVSESPGVEAEDERRRAA